MGHTLLVYVLTIQPTGTLAFQATFIFLLQMVMAHNNSCFGTIQNSLVGGGYLRGDTQIWSKSHGRGCPYMIKTQRGGVYFCTEF